MYVDGKYVSRKHPNYTPGRYKTWADVGEPLEPREIKIVDPRLEALRQEDKALYAESDNKYLVRKPGVVYVLTNPAWPKECKVGHTRHLDKRLSSFNTGSPHRDYKIEGYEHFAERAVVEKYVHNLLEKEGIERKEGEWFVCTPEYVLEKLKVLTKEYKVGTILQEDTEDIENEAVDSGHRDGRTTSYEDTLNRDERLLDQRGTQLSLTV
tara:strand:+ start:431 stop:1060 length:630 start_codon:yes stop_codon:yes gene_type:complete